MDIKPVLASQEEVEETQRQEAEEQRREHFNEFSLSDCFNRYGDQNDNELRRVIEIIEHLYPNYNLGTFLEEREVVIKHLTEYHPDLMTPEFVQRLCRETDRYAERLR